MNLLGGDASDWGRELDRRAASVRQRRDRVDVDKALCLQLEATLVELAHENESLAAALEKQSTAQEERRASLQQRLDDLSVSLGQAEDNLRRQRDQHERKCDDIGDECRAVEDELRAADGAHAFELQRLRRTQRELEEREALLREKLRSVGDREHEVAAVQRRIKSRESLLTELNRVSLERRLAELAERESLLHNEF